MSPARELGILNREGMKALADGNTANAIFLLSQALDKAHCFKTSLNEAKIHNSLGLATFMAGQQNKAQSHFERALHCVREELGEDNQLYKRIASNMDKANRGDIAA
ncbi:tetratricopeptide repeat protein [Salidesulfovibrio onnuriiensis]|uniref:tetratricopeptide repeat protein n=1 Tax=Salidesulfovibrio onnuriiensis TaxID=2583823 RepID=UPI0011CC48C5|nr:tetratricopeptide repeat protein [Salidesulfovibrio onnuriiensis]